jgi:hypothetical protein
MKVKIFSDSLVPGNPHGLTNSGGKNRQTAHCLLKPAFNTFSAPTGSGRYAIVSRGDIADATRKLQINRPESQMSHEMVQGAPT